MKEDAKAYDHMISHTHIYIYIIPKCNYCTKLTLDIGVPSHGSALPSLPYHTQAMVPAWKRYRPGADLIWKDGVEDGVQVGSDLISRTFTIC